MTTLGKDTVQYSCSFVTRIYRFRAFMKSKAIDICDASLLLGESKTQCLCAPFAHEQHTKLHEFGIGLLNQ